MKKGKPSKKLKVIDENEAVETEETDVDPSNDKDSKENDIVSTKQRNYSRADTPFPT